MFYRMRKTLTTLANVFLVVLTWKLCTGKLDWSTASGALLLSGFWLGFTAFQLRSLLETYADTLSRLRVLVPLVTGLVLSAVALFARSTATLDLIASLELIGWLGIYLAYRHNRARYKKQGHGPLPANAWVNPDWRALTPGTLMLFNGDMAGSFRKASDTASSFCRNPMDRWSPTALTWSRALSFRTCSRSPPGA